jgi:CubicO group peptidase (beta-lactamase class C family)
MPALRRATALAAATMITAACAPGEAARPETQPATHAPAQAPAQASAQTPTTMPPPRPTPAAVPPPEPAVTADFSAVSTLLNNAIAAHRLPGAVVLIGHGGRVVFHQAYGQRKLDGEPGLDGAPAPGEPMTEDTIFDVASLTKVLATAPAVMQLHERGDLEFDDPVQRYLPEFNPTNDPQRAKVTIRMLLTHTSGETGDVDLKDPWGLDRTDRFEGIHRALTTPLESPPGAGFRYSDINFILLGTLVERITGEPEDVYVQQHIFAPLHIDARYLPASKACGAHTIRGAAVASAPPSDNTACTADTWNADLLPRIAPTTRDEDGDPAVNPDRNYLLRGTVQDTTARRMGGVAGHAGVFATAGDIGRYAQALLDRLAGRPSDFPLSQESLQAMTTPQQPGHTPQQVQAANDAATHRPNPSYPLLAQRYPAIRGQNLRGFGWDIDTGQSTTRGAVFPIGGFGHTGFTGTSVWLDPGSDTYVVLLTNSVHTRGSAPISDLRGGVATLAARALHLY